MDSESVEFTEISAIESDSERIDISFRYPATSKLARQGDKIALFEDGTKESLASVRVGNPRGHWLIEDDFKAGRVVLDISKVTLSLEKRYKLCYIRFDPQRSGNEAILASSTFTMSSADGVSYQSLPEHQAVLVGNVPSPSLLDYTCVSGNPSFETNSSFECPSSGQPSSSFVVINEPDSHSQEPEALFVTDDMKSNSDTDESSVAEDIDKLPVNSVSSDTNCQNPQNIESESWIQSPSSPERSIEVLPPTNRPVPKARSNLQKKSTATHTEPREAVDSCVQVGGPLLSISAVNTPSIMGPEMPVPSEMSVSVNLGDRFMSQKEGQLLKNNNKELRLKQKKLTSVMEGMKQEIIMLKRKLEETKAVNVQVVHPLEHEVEELKCDNDVLLNRLAELEDASEAKWSELYKVQMENKALVRKNSQLVVERDTQFERSSNLLSQLQDKEKEADLLRSENVVLQGKVKRIEEEKKKKEVRQQKKDMESELRKVRERDQKRNEPKVVESIKHKARPVPQPFQNGFPVDKEPRTSRPADLPLAGGAKLKNPLPPKVSQQNSTTRSSSQTKKAYQAPLELQPSQKPSVSHTRAPRRVDPEPLSTSKLSHGSSQRSGDSSYQISEKRIEEIANSLRGAPTVECPICRKTLHAHENEYSVLLHVEHCLNHSIT